MSDAIDLRLGRWQDALADVGEVDAVITDPPYSERTHAGNSGLEDKFDGAARRDLSYCHWTVDDVREFVAAWAIRCRAWMVAMCDDELAPVWKSCFRGAGLYAFAWLPVVSPRVRLMGDGPASCAVYLCAARPKRKEFLSWGALPGWYEAEVDRSGHIGGKPLSLMRALVRDYTRPGDLVCDPCAGAGTTLLAAAIEGRRAIGSEMDPKTYELARKRIAAGYTPVMRMPEAPKPKQGALL